MRINETFVTIQGEGKYVGVPSYFIRTTGCNLRCEWTNQDGTKTKCDTPYSSWYPEKGEDLIVKRKDIPKNIKHIVITGGEPTIQKDIVAQIKEFKGNNYKVTVETNGTNYIKSTAFMSISPKLKSSYPDEYKQLHTRNNNFIEPLKKYMQNNNYQVKFVVNSKEDIKEILEIQKKLKIPNNKIYLMPQGVTKEQFKEKQMYMFNLCLEYGFNYAPRLHIDIFGNKRGI